MHIASIGIDLGKTTFHLVALGERNKILVRKKFTRAHLLAYTANLRRRSLVLRLAQDKTTNEAHNNKYVLLEQKDAAPEEQEEEKESIVEGEEDESVNNNRFNFQWN